MTNSGLTGKQIEVMLLEMFTPLRWYTRQEAIAMIEASGKLSKDDYKVIGSGEIQFHRRTSNALRDLARTTNKLERNEVTPKFWQYRIPEN